MSSKTLYFISEMVPANTHASSVVFYRHFKMLEKEGYRICWVTDRNSYQDFRAVFPPEWTLLLLPNRAWFLPPYRPYGLLQHYRFFLYARRLRREMLDAATGSLLITYINGQFLAPFTAFLKARFRLPLISFLHDDVVELNFFRGKPSLVANTRKILAASDRVLIASEAFRSVWPEYAAKFRQLYPIPERFTGTKKKKQAGGTLVFGYSGSVYDQVIPCLSALAAGLSGLGHRLIIVGNNPKALVLQERFPHTVTCRDLFDHPAEASRFLVANCDAALIVYPENISEMPWTATCFPSKFLQYCQLELPALIIAPAVSAIGRWCLQYHWPLYATDYQPETIAELAAGSLAEPVRNLVLQLKHDAFDPSRIQEQFSAVISELIPENDDTH
jgi:hypothetical protein